MTPKAKPPAPALEEQLRRFHGVRTAAETLREDGPPPERWRQKSRRLVVTEEDGLGGPGRVSEIPLDVSYDAWLMVETTVPNHERPWELEQVQTRMGLHSIRTLELVDADEA